MLEGAKGDLKKKGFTEANEANAQGLRPSDGRNIYFVCILSSPKQTNTRKKSLRSAVCYL